MLPGASLFRLQQNPTLCLAAVEGNTLQIAVCNATATTQQFSLVPQREASTGGLITSGGVEYQYNLVQHVPTQQCVTEKGADVVLAACGTPGTVDYMRTGPFTRELHFTLCLYVDIGLFKTNFCISGV